MTERKNNTIFRRRIFKIVRACLIAAVILTLALLQYFLPLRALLPPLSVSPRKEGELRLHFLYAGQADCTMVEYPDGSVVVIDAGNGGWETTNTAVRFLRGLSPARVSLVLTHADFDHYGGAQALLDSFAVDTLYLPYRGTEDERYLKMLQAAERNGCKRETLTRYGTVNAESGYPLVCLSPRTLEGEDISDNDLSTVLYLDCGGVRALFGGDITFLREDLLKSEYGISDGIFDSGDVTVRLENIDILKVSHHGSAQSTYGWAELLKPQTAVISCGRGNTYSHPAEDTVRVLSRVSDCEIYRTDELGTITVSIKDGAYTVC